MKLKNKPTAFTLSEVECLLATEREKWLKVTPRIARDEDGSVWMHVHNAAINLSVRHGPIIKKALLAWAGELEKARAIGEEKS